MFKFLKLRNSVSGDARRHVPFTSIIHKPLFILIALVFSFVAIVPIKVQAAAPQIHPEFNPILDTDIVNFQDSYLNLDPAAQAAASILFGAYVTEYAGLADYGTVFDDIPTDGTVWDRLVFAGEQVVDTIFLPVNMADQLVLTPLINLGQGIINKVKGVDDLEEFKSSILDASAYGLSYTPDIGFALNQLFAREGGLYNWQFSIEPWNSNFTWYEPNQNWASYLSYEIYRNELPTPRYLLNRARSTDNYVGAIIGYELPKYDIFLNISTNKISFHDASTISNIPFTFQYSSSNAMNTTCTLYFTDQNIPSGFSTYKDVVQYFLNLNNPYSQNCITYFKDAGNRFFTMKNSLLVNNVYVGTSWDSATLLTNSSDLGFSQTDSLQLLNPIKDAVFDLKALVEQIVQAHPDPNYELPLKPIIYNITQVDGSPLTAEDLQGISFNVTPPESGIDVPTNVFLPFFDDGKGFISYMWYMTKPLVAYTRSFLDAITFDPVDGFNASGPGYFILGVAGLGLIGGVIVKFLL